MNVDQTLTSANTQPLLDSSQSNFAQPFLASTADSVSPAGLVSIQASERSLQFQPTPDSQTALQVEQWLLGQRTIDSQLNQRGTRQRDRLVGSNQRDRLNGLQGHDILLGKRGSDRLIGHSGDDRLTGGSGDDVLRGGKGRDRLKGGKGDDILEGGKDQDYYQGGKGADIFRTRLKEASRKLKQTDRIQGFQDGQDQIALKGISFDQLDISQGTGKYQNHTLIQQRDTGKYLFILENIGNNAITAADIVGAETSDDAPSTLPLITPSITPPITSPSPPPNTATSVSITPPNTNLGAIDFSDETAVQSLGGATITIGSQRIYTGYRQVSSINQDPIVVSFDEENPANNWVRTDYEVTGSDSRGYGLFWSGTDLYGVFSVDGTQGTREEDFRRASSDATTPWLRSYGQGGGAKVAVVGRLNLTTGELLDAAYISAVLKDGKTNSLQVADISVDSSNNILVQTASRFYPRNVDGSPMLNVGNTPAPFDYTIELTPDLNQVISTSTVGVS